jgi:hypothetical protein
MRNWNGGTSRILQDNAPTHVTGEIYDALHQYNIRWVKRKFHIHGLGIGHRNDNGYGSDNG